MNSQLSRSSSMQKIGSVHIGKTTFNKHEHFFRLSPELSELKKSIKESVDSDLLELKKPKWNNSVGPTVGIGKAKDNKKRLFDVFCFTR